MIHRHEPLIQFNPVGNASSAFHYRRKNATSADLGQLHVVIRRGIHHRLHLNVRRRHCFTGPKQPVVSLPSVIDSIEEIPLLATMVLDMIWLYGAGLVPVTMFISAVCLTACRSA